ncbi:MAG: hypothetical protein JSS23_02920 [Proteobacteria bacterium]|nr:hypothetical protein [Pseudomonadota bacterium]
MTRIPLPPGHNDTGKRYPRTLSEAFPCDAHEAVAMHKMERNCTAAVSLALWLLACALGAMAVYLIANG